MTATGSTAFSDLERPPLHQANLRRAILTEHSLWRTLDVVASTGSTNVDLRDPTRLSGPSGQILIAEEQVFGRVRLDRTWRAPARSALTFSVSLRPVGPSSSWGWLPLTAALAIDETLRRFDVRESGIKWPNDVLVGERKIAGILSERVETDRGPVAIVGIGVNVSLTESELPFASATSLALVDAPTDRDPLLRALLRALEQHYALWARSTPGVLKAAYLKRSSTIGRSVRVVLPGGREILGTAEDVDESGGLVVNDGLVSHLVAAADVTHAHLGSH